jgi:hypothetical protein
VNAPDEQERREAHARALDEFMTPARTRQVVAAMVRIARGGNRDARAYLRQNRARLDRAGFVVPDDV